MSRIATCVIISVLVPAVLTSRVTTITGIIIMDMTMIMRTGMHMITGMITITGIIITPIPMRIIRLGRNRSATARRPVRTSNAIRWKTI